MPAHGGQRCGTKTLIKSERNWYCMGLGPAPPMSQMMVVVLTLIPVGTEFLQSCRVQITWQGMEDTGHSCFLNFLDKSHILNISFLTGHMAVYLISSID